MSNYRTWWLLFALLISSCADSEQGSTRVASEAEIVLVANRALKVGEWLEPDVLVKHPLHESYVSPDLVRASAAEKLQGLELKVPIERGEPLRWSIVGAPWGGRLSNIVRKFGRALTVEASGLEWVRPNDHVDILATLPDPETGKLATVTLIQNVIVVAVGSQFGGSARMDPDPRDPNFGRATFMLLPEEVEQIVMAARMGPLTVSLRNPEDIHGTEARKPVLVDSLIGRDETEKPVGKTK